ncbi:MAG: glutathione S-transferase family protein [Rhodobacteraceae bacterium]|nr:glutathione S-transferase family protein [Paracoccaceae bacterium]
MRLFYTPGTVSIAAAIALEEAGLTYEPELVNFAKAEQTQPPYLAINPKGRVPALAVGDTILTETGAILDYIAAIAPEARLVPDDPIAAAHMRSVMYYLASTMHVNHAHKMRGHRWADSPDSHADMTAKVTETMTASAQFLEDTALLGDYVCGDALSIGDAYLFIVCTWLPGDGVALSDFPIINAFMDRMNARASVQEARAKGMLR